jgi:hypothetical protein
MEGPEPDFIEDEEVNEKTLKHYGLRAVKV